MIINQTTKFNVGDKVYLLNGVKVITRIIESVNVSFNGKKQEVLYQFACSYGLMPESELYPSFEAIKDAIYLEDEKDED